MNRLFDIVRGTVETPADEATVLQTLDDPLKSASHWVRVTMPGLLSLMGMALWRGQMLGFCLLLALVAYSLVAVQKGPPPASGGPGPDRAAAAGPVPDGDADVRRAYVRQVLLEAEESAPRGG